MTIENCSLSPSPQKISAAADLIVHNNKKEFGKNNSVSCCCLVRPTRIVLSYRIKTSYSYSYNSWASDITQFKETASMSVNQTPEEIAAFKAAVAQAVEALMPELRARLFEEFRQEASGSGSGGGTPVTISGWLEKFGKQKPRSFSSTNTPVDAENWIAYIEKIFEVLDCGDEFKARLAAEQQKFDREYHTIRQEDRETTNEFMKRFLRLAGFLGAKAGTQEEQASHFKWGLKEWILDGIVNTEFTDVAQVANAGRNIELLRERNRENKRNRDGDRIRFASASKVRDQRYHDSESTTTCEICGKWHPGKTCHKISGACFACGSIEHKISDCPRRK
ncbi:zinc finger, CCHC-type, Retrotransposon gag domain protein [Artemisia annua]|uniref:Zinc finger, CCHC-type, Retrotransposon gag domain protein n=1 Tax=Artemisia annua TaxID=35608 RepID=A0A2U1N9X3_ARTAN|nr:zinc finger, CCHC-type, Retrotransposon gag domain protein [Artemisia annua]